MKSIHAIFGTALALVLVSCTTTAKSKWTQEDLDKLDREYVTYATSDLPSARQALLRCLKLLEHSDPEAHGYADALWFTYARLHSVEHRSGNHNMEVIYFQHAGYWFMRRLENHESATSEIAKKLEEYTPSRSLEMMQNWDDSYIMKSEQSAAPLPRAPQPGQSEYDR